MSETEFHCQQCGRCCVEHGTNEGTAKDFKRWKKEGRYDIICHPCVDTDIGDIGCVGEMTGCNRKEFHELLEEREKQTGLEFLWGGSIDYCPFLKYAGKNKENGQKKYKCLIHETKTESCRNFPFDEQGKVNLNDGYGLRVGCPEIQRLRNLKGLEMHTSK